jgi:selenocysteine-specific elongation factor
MNTRCLASYKHAYVERVTIRSMYVIGTAGHVDHGKSTLVKALTGIDPDRWAEEQRREMTIDLGFAWLTLPSGRSVSLIDVPGHERFIKNMLAGVGGITPRYW